MNSYTDSIRDIVVNTLRRIVTNDYILLDLPYQTNVGDVLLWQAFEDMKPLLEHRCLYQCSEFTYKKPQIGEDVVIVFMGGGNFGDLWEHHQTFRHRVMKEFPNNPIVQLQQSVWFQDKEKLAIDIEKFTEHKGKVSICLRDKQSYDIIVNNYPTVDAYLLPDLALALDINEYCRKHRIEIMRGRGALLAQRRDKEAVDATKYNLPEGVVINDWPCMVTKLPKEVFWQKWLRRTEKYLHIKALTRRLTDLVYLKILKEEYVRSGIQFISQYEVIYATRLHVAILAGLLGKETYIIDNSYKKISGVYGMWMQDLKNVKLLAQKDEVA